MSEYITDAEIDEMVRRLEAHVAVDIRTALRDAVLWGARYAEVRQQSKSELSDDARDAARFRKLMGLMAYGEVTIDRAIYVDGGGAEKQMVFDWIGEVEHYLDDPSLSLDLRAKAGHEDDTRHSPYREPPSEPSKPNSAED